jgi:hypothetical protein
MVVSESQFASMVGEVASSIDRVVSHAVSGFDIRMKIRSGSRKLSYDVSASMDPNSGKWSTFSPYPGTGALIILVREVGARLRSGS